MTSISETGGRIQVLSVFLDNTVFGIPIARIQDVLRPLQLTKVPLAPGYVEGISNLRGRIVTAINLRKRVQNGDSGSCASAGEHMNVVVDSKGELYSILVDRVGDVLTLENEQVENPPLTLNQSWRDVTCGVHQLNGSIMIILDTERIIHEGQS